MASNLANLNVQYENYANYWMKLYEPATNNAKVIYNDTDETSAFDKLQINIDGFLITIPHANGFYDAYLFPTESDANKNITTNAIKIADNISADKLTAADITTASEIDLGLVKLASEQDVIDYVVDLSDGALNGTPPDPEKVMNIQRAYEMIQQAAGGGGGLDIGDIILKEETVGDIDDSYLKLNGAVYDETLYPDLALFPNYLTGENITSVDLTTVTDIVVSTQPDQGYQMIKVSDTVYYALSTLLGSGTSRAGFYKSIDAGLTWTALAGPWTLSQTFDASVALVFNGVDEILVIASERAIIFNTTSEIWTTPATLIVSFGNIPLNAHYNSNLSKWVVMYSMSSSPQGIQIYTSIDGISWVLENHFAISETDNDTSGIKSGIPSAGLDGMGGTSYKDGFYYICARLSRNIYKINENNFNEEVVFNYDSLVYDGNTSNVIIPLNVGISITDKGSMAVIVYYNNNVGFKILTSKTGNKNDWDLKLYKPSLFNQLNQNQTSFPAKYSKLIPISGESFMLSDATNMYFSITPDLFETEVYTYNLGVAVNVQTGINNFSFVYNQVSDEILIDIPARTTGNTHKQVLLDITLNSGFKTIDLSDKNLADNTAYYVKAK